MNYRVQNCADLKTYAFGKFSGVVKAVWTKPFVISKRTLHVIIQNMAACLCKTMKQEFRCQLRNMSLIQKPQWFLHYSAGVHYAADLLMALGSVVVQRDFII